MCLPDVASLAVTGFHAHIYCVAISLTHTHYLSLTLSDLSLSLSLCSLCALAGTTSTEPYESVELPETSCRPSWSPFQTRRLPRVDAASLLGGPRRGIAAAPRICRLVSPNHHPASTCNLDTLLLKIVFFLFLHLCELQFAI